MYGARTGYIRIAEIEESGSRELRERTNVGANFTFFRCMWGVRDTRPRARPPSIKKNPSRAYIIPPCVVTSFDFFWTSKLFFLFLSGPGEFLLFSLWRPGREIFFPSISARERSVAKKKLNGIIWSANPGCTHNDLTHLTLVKQPRLFWNRSTASVCV